MSDTKTVPLPSTANNDPNTLPADRLSDLSGLAVEPIDAERTHRNTALLVPVSSGSENALSEQLELLNRSIAETNRLVEHRELTIDRLHEENQKLRMGELQQAVAPIIRDLIRLFDDVERRMAVVAVDGDKKREPHDANSFLGDFREAVNDILYRQGIERYDADLGAPFDGRQHRASQATATDQPGADRTIARVIRCGFRNDTRIVRPLEAEVFRLRTNLPHATDQNEHRANSPNSPMVYKKDEEKSR